MNPSGGRKMKIKLTRQWQNGRLGRAAARVLRLRNDDGNATLELAFVIPGLAIVLTAVLSFGMAFFILQEMSKAAAFAVTQVGATEGLSAYPDPCSVALSTFTATFPEVGAGSLSYRLVIFDKSGVGHTYNSTTSGGTTSFSCTAGAAQEAPNEVVVLTVTCNYKWMPILTFTPSSALKATESAVAD
jgi:Flp pilus assembly protein TadG